MSQWYANLIWPELLDQDATESDEYLKQPDFPDDNWALWRQDLSEEAEALIRSSGASALLAWAAWGPPLKDAREPIWVTPQQLEDAAITVRRLLDDDAARQVLLANYEDYGDRATNIREQFTDDLAVIAKKAMWARSLGKAKVSFNVHHSGSN